MKKRLIAAAVTAVSLMSFNASAETTSVDQADIKQAQALVKEFGGQLKPALKQAMKSGGPVEAVKVCQQKAPAIAKELSEKSGWEVTRVSLKARGAMAQPDAWEQSVLEGFVKQNASGTKAKDLELSEIVHEQSGSQVRYMKAIGTAGMCLQCHGENIAEPVKAALAQYYPDDKATGYKKGEIRGAFSFSKAVK